MSVVPPQRPSTSPRRYPPAMDGKPVPKSEPVAAPNLINEVDLSAAPEQEPGRRSESLYQASRRTVAVQLPSKGRFYGGKLPDGNIEIFTLTATEDKILAELSPENIVEIFDAVLSRCVRSNISPAEMLESDRYYLLLALRANSLGEAYDFPYTCPFEDCKHSFIHIARIPTELELLEGKAKEEPFYVKLPITGHTVGLRFLRGTDTKDIIRYRKQSVNVNQEIGDTAYAYQHAKQIVTVDGKSLPDISAAEEWFMNLPLRDVRTFKSFAAQAAPGLSALITVKCPKCSKEAVTGLPLSLLSFFS